MRPFGPKEIIADRFEEFDYEHDLAVRWHLRGRQSPIVIDPRTSFGAPAIRGIPTWALKGRWKAGESVDELADDFGIPLRRRSAPRWISRR